MTDSGDPGLSRTSATLEVFRLLILWLLMLLALLINEVGSSQLDQLEKQPATTRAASMATVAIRRIAHQLPHEEGCSPRPRSWAISSRRRTRMAAADARLVQASLNSVPPSMCRSTPRPEVQPCTWHSADAPHAPPAGPGCQQQAGHGLDAAGEVRNQGSNQGRPHRVLEDLEQVAVGIELERQVPEQDVGDVSSEQVGSATQAGGQGSRQGPLGGAAQGASAMAIIAVGSTSEVRCPRSGPDHPMGKCRVAREPMQPGYGPLAWSRLGVDW